MNSVDILFCIQKLFDEEVKFYEFLIERIHKLFLLESYRESTNLF